jgi:SAM-dependent methyltransferase
VIGRASDTRAVDANLVTLGFDDVAARYDDEFTHTAFGRALRRIVWPRVMANFRPKQLILELGCGTGEDAIELARAGMTVVATDASAAMIALARQKARRAGFLDRIEFECVPMEDVGRAYTGLTFDGLFSNFGAVNCTGDMSLLAADLADLLHANGALVWVIMGRHVPWEWLWYLLHADPGRAFRRYRAGGVTWRGLRVQYPTPSEVVERIKPAFSVTRVSPLGVVLPPSYAAGWLNRSPNMLAAMTRLESLAQRSSALASWADHYVVEARRGERKG